MDTFAIDNLPPVEKWPEFSNLAELDYQEKMNGVEYYLGNLISKINYKIKVGNRIVTFWSLTKH